MKTQCGQSLGVAIADPALQPGMGLLLAFYMLALPLGIVLGPRLLHFTPCHFLAHMSLRYYVSEFVISHHMPLSIGRCPFHLGLLAARQIYHQINKISFNIKNEVTQLCQSKPSRA
nr:hypothetical protein [Aeromonas veronii]